MAVITGARGNFAFSSGGDSLANVDLFDVSFELGPPPFRTTPFGYLLHRHTPGFVTDVRGTCSAYVTDSGKPTVPTGTSGTLVITTKTSQTYTFKAALFSLASNINSTQDDPQVARYTFASTPTTTTDTIT